MHCPPILHYIPLYYSFLLSLLISLPLFLHSFFFFNDTATTEIYTLSLHGRSSDLPSPPPPRPRAPRRRRAATPPARSEEHTSELQSLAYLVCRLLLEKKKKTIYVDNLPDYSHMYTSITYSDVPARL